MVVIQIKMDVKLIFYNYYDIIKFMMEKGKQQFYNGYI